MINTRTNAGGVDTELALFSSTGTAILENDDANGTTTDSSITTTLAAGTYYLGVASSENEPVNSANQLLFVGLSQSGDTTAVRGPASGINRRRFSVTTATSTTPPPPATTRSASPPPRNLPPGPPSPSAASLPLPPSCAVAARPDPRLTILSFLF